MSPRSSRSCARPSSRPWRRYWVPTSSGWRRSSTATAPAPPTCRSTHRANPALRHTAHAEATTRPSKERRHDDYVREPLTQEETIASLGRYGYGWADSDVAGASAQRGCPRRWCATSRARRASPSGCSTSGSRRCAPSTRSRCRTGAPTSRASTSTTSSTSCAPARSRPRPGMTCPRTSRTPTTSSASRRRRSSGWCPVSPRSTNPRSSTTRSGRTWRARASSSSTPTPR